MKIKRAVKSAAVDKEIREVMAVAKKAGIYGLEIQEIFPLIENLSFKQRAEIIVNAVKDYPPTSLAFHFPLKYGLDDTSFAKKFDLSSPEGDYILKLTEDTVKEAAFTADALNVRNETPIIVHLLGFAEPENVTLETRKEKLRLGKNRLKVLKEIADFHSQKSGVKLTVVRENNPPECDKIISMLDSNPAETLGTVDEGIGVNLDFAHLWLNILYQKNGQGEFPGADFNRKINKFASSALADEINPEIKQVCFGDFSAEINLEKTVKALAPYLKLIHLNDAGPGYGQEFEGVEIGTGNVPHDILIPLICENLTQDIIGTYEIKYGHKDPDSMFRSDMFYRNLFKEKFEEYFI